MEDEKNSFNRKSKKLKREESDSEDEGVCGWCCRKEKEKDPHKDSLLDTELDGKRDSIKSDGKDIQKDKKRRESSKKEDIFFNYGVGINSYFELQWGLISLFFFLSILACLQMALYW